MAGEKTNFQRRFEINVQFYTREEIIGILLESFPKKNDVFEGIGFRGLVGILNEGGIIGCRKPEDETDLRNLVVDYSLIFKNLKGLPKTLVNSLLVIFEEDESGNPYLTKFIPTDCGYICIEQKRGYS